MAGKRTQAKAKGRKKRMGTITVYGSVPDTLITCVFATLGGECGILGWIKTTKEKKQDRRWQLADMRREKEEAERIAQQTEEP